MSRQQYSRKESLNRIVRSWLGLPIPSDIPDTLSGSIVSEDEAFSLLAELFEDSVPGETPTIPNSIKASAAEAVAGTNDTKAVTPLALASAIAAEAHEYGEIYTSTGTVTMSVGTSEVKVTGSFHVNGMSSDNVTPDFDDDRIVINSVGAYFVPFQLAFSGAANATFTIQVYLDGVAQPQIKTVRKLNAGSDVGSCSGQGMINVTGSNMAVDLYVVADGAAKSFMIEAGQLYVEKAPV